MRMDQLPKVLDENGATLGATHPPRPGRKQAPRRAHKLGPFSQAKYIIAPDRRTKFAKQLDKQRAGYVAQCGGRVTQSQAALIDQILITTAKIDLLLADMAASEDCPVWKYTELSARQAALLAYIRELHQAAAPPPATGSQYLDDGTSNEAPVVSAAREMLMAKLDALASRAVIVDDAAPLKPDADAWAQPCEPVGDPCAPSPCAGESPMRTEPVAATSPAPEASTRTSDSPTRPARTRALEWPPPWATEVRGPEDLR